MCKAINISYKAVFQSIYDQLCSGPKSREQLLKVVPFETVAQFDRQLARGQQTNSYDADDKRWVFKPGVGYVVTNRHIEKLHTREVVRLENEVQKLRETIQNLQKDNILVPWRAEA